MNLFPDSKLLNHFYDYEQVHQHAHNKKSHYFGLPLVLISTLGLLAQVHILSNLDLGLILIFVASLFTFRIDFKIAIPFTLFAYFTYLISRHIPVLTLVVIQALGWGFQLVGHYVYEKKSPAFFKSLSHIVIGPLWLFSTAIGYYKTK